MTIDVSSYDKYEEVVDTLLQKKYIEIDFQKAIPLLNAIIGNLGVKNLYTSRTPTNYVEGTRVSFGSEFFTTDVSVLPNTTEADLDAIITETANQYKTAFLDSEFLYPPNYVFTIRHVRMYLNVQSDTITECEINGTFVKVDDQSWP